MTNEAEEIAEKILEEWGYITFNTNDCGTRDLIIAEPIPNSFPKPSFPEIKSGKTNDRERPEQRRTRESLEAIGWTAPTIYVPYRLSLNSRGNKVWVPDIEVFKKNLNRAGYYDHR